MKRSIGVVFGPVAILLAVSCGTSYKPTSATKVYVISGGDYIAAATVSIDGKQNVTSAEFRIYRGPGNWAEYNSEDGKSLVDGAVVRIPDPMANTSSADPQIKGYQFYIYTVTNGEGSWLTYNPGKDGFSRPTGYEIKTFKDLIDEPIRAAAYAKAAADDTLVNVKIDGTKVIVGKPASQTVRTGRMNNADPASTYMPITSDSIGFRYNYRAIIDFFIAHPTADFFQVKQATAKLTLSPNPAVDASGDEAKYTAATDRVWGVADAYAGATISSFPRYIMELQNAYQMALAKQLKDF